MEKTAITPTTPEILKSKIRSADLKTSSSEFAKSCRTNILSNNHISIIAFEYKKENEKGYDNHIFIIKEETENSSNSILLIEKQFKTECHEGWVSEIVNDVKEINKNA